jgi:hypothetical protein
VCETKNTGEIEIQKPLNSDELGEKGEKFFDGICVDAKLVSNPSVRDRNGWDRIVEFPIDSSNPMQSIDSRPPGVSCHVQIKTIWTGGKSVRMTLSSAERLAKEPKPSFIYVLLVGADLKAKRAYLVHMSGGTLELILKRLRVESVKFGHKVKLNKKYITIPVSCGSEIELSGAALKSKILKSLGEANSIGESIERKRNEMLSVGYADATHVGTLTFKASNTESLVSAALGLNPIALSSLDMSEVRFGIKQQILKLSGSSAQLSVSPANPIQCKLMWRAGSCALRRNSVSCISRLTKGGAAFFVSASVT